MSADRSDENDHDGCDCTALCSMGPTCPGGSLAGLPGSGCSRVNPPAPDLLAALQRSIEAAREERKTTCGHEDCCRYFLCAHPTCCGYAVMSYSPGSTTSAQPI